MLRCILICCQNRAYSSIPPQGRVPMPASAVSWLVFALKHSIHVWSVCSSTQRGSVSNSRRGAIKVENHGPVLYWENVSTERESKGLLDSSYLVERARVPGGWMVIAQFKLGGSH